MLNASALTVEWWWGWKIGCYSNAWEDVLCSRIQIGYTTSTTVGLLFRTVCNSVWDICKFVTCHL